MSSPVSLNLAALARRVLAGAVRNSERTQQNRTNKYKHSKGRQHFKPQGKVHVGAPSLLTWPKSSRDPPPQEMRNMLRRHEEPA